MSPTVPPPLVIVGPTASGKSGTALALAERTPACEIVSADAMAVYRGMNIGTAKPTASELERVRHHLVDVVDSSESYTVARFSGEVDQVLHQVESTGVPVIIVGGTGLYVQSVVDNFTMPPNFP